MLKKLLVLALGALLCQTAAFAADWSAYDGGEVAVPLPDKSDPDTGLFAIVVNAHIYDSISTEVNQYRLDLIDEGYRVVVHSTSDTTPQQVRSWLDSTYTADGNLVGTILIGNLPGPQIYYACNPTYDVISDYYFMDLDGNWIDSDSDAVYDTYSGNTDAEIFYGRLYTKTLTYTGESEVALLRLYLNKLHSYREGNAVLGHSDLPPKKRTC